MLLLVVVQGLLLGNSDGTGELPRGTVGAPAVAGGVRRGSQHLPGARCHAWGHRDGTELLTYKCPVSIFISNHSDEKSEA